MVNVIDPNRITNYLTAEISTDKILVKMSHKYFENNTFPLSVQKRSYSGI